MKSVCGLLNALKLSLGHAEFQNMFVEDTPLQRRVEEGEKGHWPQLV